MIMERYCLYSANPVQTGRAEASERDWNTEHVTKINPAEDRKISLHVIAAYRGNVSGETTSARRLRSSFSSVENIWNGVLVVGSECPARGDNHWSGIVSRTSQYPGTKHHPAKDLWSKITNWWENILSSSLASRREYKTIKRRARVHFICSWKESVGANRRMDTHALNSLMIRASPFLRSRNRHVLSKWSMNGTSMA